MRRRLDQLSSGSLAAKHRDILVFAGPGAGKTLGALLGFCSMRRDGHFDRFVVFGHRTSILGQWKQAAVGLGLCLEEWPCTEAAAKAADGLLVTYQGAGRQLKSLQEQLGQLQADRCLAIADEAPHLGLDPDDP